MSSLLATKLHRPSPPRRRVPRPQLLKKLDEGLGAGRQITLISAPAGFGKTVCASEWLGNLELPVSWLALDPADDDPGRFFSYLIAALQKIDSDLCLEIEAVLRAGELPPLEILTSSLINDVLGLDQPFILALDDFQVIQDPLILGVWETLVENLPPKMHLVLVTREDPSLPLARLRANNQLSEIRAADLRFSRPETGQFLDQVMGIFLNPQDIAALEKRTEGWVAGLHLAALSIRGRQDPSEFIAGLSGSHRFILNYLTEEVLNQQPAEIQAFLLQTSILDRLNGDLCDALTGRTDSHRLLEHLRAANLFLIPLDDEGQWYRYHQLFADLLRDRQAHAAGTEELHRRASAWYARCGRISEAIEHALVARDYEAATGLIESHAMDMLMQWHLKTVEGWMRSIPAAWIAQSPRANLAFAWMHLMRANHARAFPYLERLRTLFANPQTKREDPALGAKWLALQAMLLNAQGKQMEGLKLCQQALEIVPEDDVQVRGMVYLGLANAYQQMDDYQEAREAFETLIQLGQMAGNSVSELLGVSGLALLALQQGQYHFAYQVVTQGIERVERSGSLPPISTALFGELAVIHYQWHQLERAHRYFQRAIQVSTLSGYSDAELYYGVILSRLFQIQGDLETASEKIQNAVDLMAVEAPSAVREEVIAQQVRIELARGNLVAAEEILEGHGFAFRDRLVFPGLDVHRVPFFSRDGVTRSVWTLYASALRVLLHRAQKAGDFKNLQAGVELANRLIQATLDGGYIPLALEMLLARAQIHAALGDTGASQRDYLQALELGQPEGFISIFVEEGAAVAGVLEALLDQFRLGNVRAEYIRRILTAYPEETRLEDSPAPQVSSAMQGLIEPLSRRELEILRLIGEGYTNQQIAERLVVTLHTVKKHSSNLYAKLGVNSRTQAIARGRQLKLL